MDEIKLGRPRMTPEEKIASAARKAEYNKKWRSEHKDAHKLAARKSVAKAIANKTHYCEACNKCFSSRCNLQYHLTLSRAHK